VCLKWHGKDLCPESFIDTRNSFDGNIVFLTYDGNAGFFEGTGEYISPVARTVHPGRYSKLWHLGVDFNIFTYHLVDVARLANPCAWRRSVRLCVAEKVAFHHITAFAFRGLLQPFFKS